jgi:hypothetical protein
MGDKNTTTTKKTRLFSVYRLWRLVKILKFQDFGHIDEIEKKKNSVCQVKTEEHACGMQRHARLECSTGLKETLKLRECPGDGWCF